MKIPESHVLAELESVVPGLVFESFALVAKVAAMDVSIGEGGQSENGIPESVLAPPDIKTLLKNKLVRE